MFKIEKKVPIPKGDQGRTAKYPCAEMVIGDSFLVPEGDGTAGGVPSRIAYWRLKTGFKFKTRSVKGGVRVWRVA